MCFCCVSHDQANEIIWQAKRERRPMTDNEVDTVTQLIEHSKPVPDRLLSSPDLPPLPWSSPADRQPWPDQAADPRRIRDADGRTIFGGRNWKEACAAIEYLVRSANKAAV